jgi:hypothetical protein
LRSGTWKEDTVSTSTAQHADVDLSSYRTMPVNADEGFPQSFLVALGTSTYRVDLYVNVAEHLLPRWPPNPRILIDVVGDQPELPVKGSLVCAVFRRGDDGDVPLMRRRLLPGITHTLDEVSLVVVETRVALGNLNAAGPFGSVVDVRVRVRLP